MGEQNGFLVAAREKVLQYLTHFEVPFRAVDAQPEWHLSPQVAVWRVRGTHDGWFAISGDVPTDYVSTDEARDARAALDHFSRVWLEAAECMADGKPPPSFVIGKPDDWRALAPLLRTRATLLAEFAADDSLWE